MTEQYKRGLKVRRDVLGDEWVDRVLKATTKLDEEFQRFITETVWAGLWSRPGLDRRTRRLVTIAILAALGREELRPHLRSLRRDGVTDEELLETLLHVALYAGVPAANHAVAVAKEELPRSGSRRSRSRRAPGA